MNYLKSKCTFLALLIASIRIQAQQMSIVPHFMLTEPILLHFTQSYPTPVTKTHYNFSFGLQSNLGICYKRIEAGIGLGFQKRSGHTNKIGKPSSEYDFGGKTWYRTVPFYINILAVNRKCWSLGLNLQYSRILDKVYSGTSYLVQDGIKSTGKVIIPLQHTWRIGVLADQKFKSGWLVESSVFLESFRQDLTWEDNEDFYRREPVVNWWDSSGLFIGIGVGISKPFAVKKSKVH
jgi:hypothetical protein